MPLAKNIYIHTHMLLGGEWPIPWSEIKVPVLLVGYTRDKFATPTSNLCILGILAK